MLAPIALGVKFQMACLLMSLICKMPPLYIWVLCMFNLISVVSRFFSEMWWFYFHYASRNMAFNKLNQNIPHSLPNLKHLRHLWVANLLTTFFAYLVYDYSSVISSFLYVYFFHFFGRNLSHNMLSGPIGSVFTGLENLKELYVFCQISCISSGGKVRHLNMFKLDTLLGPF